VKQQQLVDFNNAVQTSEKHPYFKKSLDQQYLCLQNGKKDESLKQGLLG